MRGLREGWTKHPWEWLLLLTGVALGVTLAAAPGAGGSFHELRIREWFPGTSANADSAFLELQMASAGQGTVGGTELTFYNASGNLFDTVPLSNDVANDASQRTILIGDTSVSAAFGVTPDFTYVDLDGIHVIHAAGAACFDGPPGQHVDCVGWGTFSNMPALPLGVPEPGAIPDGSSLLRSISRGCPTLLELADDSDDSSSDFSYSDTPTPRPNALIPEERACPLPPRTARCGGRAATKVGTARGELLVGTPRPDVIAGLGGNDRIRGLAGNDVLCGGKGRDKLIGGKGRDRLLGQAGRDLCRGGAGRDRARRCEVKRTI